MPIFCAAAATALVFASCRGGRPAKTDSRQTFRENVEPLGIKRFSQHGDAGDVPAGLRQAHSHAFRDGIATEECCDDRDVRGGGCDGPDDRGRHRDDDVRLGAR